MAAGYIQPPGSEYGPCKEECRHVDCAQTRTMAESVCKYCEQIIGYERGFYNLANHGDIPVLVHSACHLQALDTP